MKKLLSSLLALAMLLTLLPLGAVGVSAASTYYINGVSVRNDDFPSADAECWAYANNVYRKIWGVNFSNSFSDSANSLRNLSDSELTLTLEHLKTYVTNAALGSCLRICDKEYLHGSDGWGHSQIIVQKDSNGFTVFEGGLSSYPYRREKYYTWSEYINTGWLQYDYIKYIKWPNAPAYSAGYDISFKASGGSCSITEKVVNEGSSLGTLPTPTLEGYTFAGWYTQPYYDGDKVVSSTVPSGDMTLYAHWQRSDYWVYFVNPYDDYSSELCASIDRVNDGRGGAELVVFNENATSSWTNEYGYEVAVNSQGKVVASRLYGDEEQLEIPSGGFVLSGQYAWDSSISSGYGGYKVTNQIISMDEAYVAIDYAAGTITVYDSYEKYVARNKYVAYGEPLGVLPYPSRDGYTFIGWYAQDGTKYFSHTAVTENVDLYPVWDEEYCDFFGHDMDVTIYDATCQEYELRHYYCTRCDYEYDETIEGVLGSHQYYIVSEKAPNCTEYGYTLVRCDICGKEHYDYADPRGHDYVTLVHEPTCTKQGYTEYCCFVCEDYFKSDYVDALGHSHFYYSHVDATCGEPGEIVYKCDSCNDSYTTVIPATGEHKYDNVCDAVCNDCGATRSVTHSYIDATCTTPKTCSFCGASSGKANGHNYESATCTEPQTCKTCGATNGSAPGHVYTSECDSECNVCGEARKVSGHKWSNGKCSVCGIASSKVTITTQPKTTYANYGKYATVTVNAKGDGLKYQWYVSDVGDTKYYKSSITTATYKLKMTASNSNRKAYCVITDKYGNNVTSNTVRLRVKATVTAEPKTAYANYGKYATVTVKAKGDGLKYTWYVSDVGDTKYYKSSITTATYKLKMTASNSNRKAYCVITDKYGKKVTTQTVRLRVKATITTQPKTVTVKKNATAKVTVKAKGDGLKYTWYVKDVGDKKYYKSSITKSTYSMKMTSKVKNRLAYCVVTDKYGKTVKSTTVKLKMK